MSLIGPLKVSDYLRQKAIAFVFLTTTATKALVQRTYNAKVQLLRKYEQESTRLYLKKINFPERAELATRQLHELDRLRHQARGTRITTQKRHSQEQTALNQQFG